MKRRIIALAMTAAAVCSCAALAACSPEGPATGAETVTITCLNAEAQPIEKEVPLEPERVAILDYAVLDMMDALGVGDKVVSSATGTISYLQDYWDKAEDGSISNLGNLQSYSMELLQQSEPDIIFIGGRQSANYAQFEEIAPVVYLSVTAGNIVEETLENFDTVGAIFGKTQTEIDAVKAEYDIASRVEALAALSKDADGEASTCLNIMWNSASSFSALSSDGRLSLIVGEIGFDNVNTSFSESQHGSATSWEAIAETDPDYIFVMNRSYITSNDGSSPEQAAEAVRSEMQAELDKVGYSGTLVVLLNPDVWYTAEGGLQALDTMLSDLESALIKG